MHAIIHHIPYLKKGNDPVIPLCPIHCLHRDIYRIVSGKIIPVNLVRCLKNSMSAMNAAFVEQFPTPFDSINRIVGLK